MQVKLTVGDYFVEVNVTGKYNPDILEDIANRACRVYRDALAANLEAGTDEAATAEDTPDSVA